jgi:hypothetical protein
MEDWYLAQPATTKGFERENRVLLSSLWGEQDAVFVDLDLRRDPDTYGGPFRAVVNEDFFIGRGAPIRTVHHFRNLVNRVVCVCSFCEWFKKNLIVE